MIYFLQIVESYMLKKKRMGVGWVVDGKSTLWMKLISDWCHCQNVLFNVVFFFSIRISELEIQTQQLETMMNRMKEDFQRK